MRPPRAPLGRHDMPAAHARHLSRRLARIRARSDLTQRDLALRIRVTRNTLLRWETADLTPTTLSLLRWIAALGAGVAIADQDGRIHHVSPPDTDDPEASARAVYIRIAAVLAAERRRLAVTPAEIATVPGLGKLRHWEHARRYPTLYNLFAWCREIGCKILIALPADHPAAQARQSAPARPRRRSTLAA